MILADEPTGALDSVSSEEVLQVLQELNRQGHTVIIVTHDAAVAAHAHRIIELSDGVVVADRATRQRLADPERLAMRPTTGGSWLATTWSRIAEAAVMAVRSMASHRLRTALTTLGIIIGICSVASVVALGEGSRKVIIAEIGSLGTNTIDVFTGRGFGDQKALLALPLTAGDARALSRLHYVDSVTPSVGSSVSLRRGNVDRLSTVIGVGDQFFQVRGLQFAAGQAFDENAGAAAGAGRGDRRQHASGAVSRRSRPARQGAAARQRPGPRGRHHRTAEEPLPTTATRRSTSGFRTRRRWCG